MKKLKTFTAVLAAAMALTLMPGVRMTVRAAEPVTYAVKYVSDKEGWCYVQGSEFTGYYTSVYYLREEKLKDGDLVVVYNEAGTQNTLDLGNIHLSNLTVMQNTQWCMIKTGSVDDFFALSGSSSTITGDVANGHVYGDALCNFNNNVQLLNLYSEANGSNHMTVGCSGKVDQLVGRNVADDDCIYYTYYGFGPNTLSVTNGYLATPEEKYSKEPIATATQQETPAAAITASASDDDEYDDVPKTGRSNLFLWMLFASAVCFAGSRALKRASR